ncbi:fungal specific transcription factor domain-containing protein [Colletotrichum orchidophilum]|uniref:Fungal specific transcription factor domain-containing protein n=1 Tax=Colletotrichum orchidophilum TaxID=1209926 RepID=A0A1G4BP18_9PEZI|nr:fungal specific transcription factor domain-containing protein [Colletotrichum orchidophilum]OHF03057.1 fungal specific transcription factor domain-containing protein [Colletotrichum orchidophilum]
MDAPAYGRPLPGPAGPAPNVSHASSTTSTTAASSPHGGSRKRTLSSAADQHSPLSEEPARLGPSLSSAAAAAANRRKLQKVSRACDFCKQRKARCSGTIPCDKCTGKGLTCVYDAKYSRGRPPTPPPSAVWSSASNAVSGSEEPPVVAYRTTEGEGGGEHATAPAAPSRSLRGHVRESQGLGSRASPELGIAEIQGQVFDPTSGVTFLHRAWKRLSKHESNIVPDELSASTEGQPLMLAGDKPLPPVTDEDVTNLSLPDSEELKDLLALYFDLSIATYRVLHRPSVEAWLRTMTTNIRHGKAVWQDIGRARASIVLTVLAIATAHNEKSKGSHSPEGEALSLARGDQLFCVALQLTERETGLPRLESAQSRLIQVLYLLTTSRMNRAWYTFGNALQIISALGMHRKGAKKRHLTPGNSDYIQAQCRMRTFWTSYILDNHLGVIFGRPRHFHDDDIDQDYPDKITDEDMAAQGPIERSEEHSDCHIDALIFHAKIAQIIGNTSREVYSIKAISEQERVAAAHRLSEKIHDWRASLPPHLGSIRPSMLIPSFRRQATVLKLAYSHAIMHANRLFLLGNPSSGSETQIVECIGAARTVLETVDGMAAEGPIFHAFWWTQYVTFCALLVTYVCDIQQKRRWVTLDGEGKAKHTKLMDLAERCQTHLAHATASNSPSRRYAIILEEFRTEGLGQVSRQAQVSSQAPRTLAPRLDASSAYNHVPPPQTNGGNEAASMTAGGFGFNHAYATESGTVDPMDHGDAGFLGSNVLDEWQTTDWLDLDSSAFGPYLDVDSNPLAWMPDIGG